MAHTPEGSAKYSSNALDDQAAISIVQTALTLSRKAVPQLNAHDSVPNTDGYIELISDEGIHQGVFWVQVKKLSKKASSKLTYSFSDKKFLSYCQEHANLEPILFLGVDIETQVVYWQHMGPDLLKALGNSKTLHLNKEQCLTNSDHTCINQWRTILREYKDGPSKLAEAKQKLEKISQDFSPALGQKKAEFRNIHIFLDTLNDLLDHKFQIIKELDYPDTWKLGFAYNEYTASRLAYGLYQIPRDKNDIQIKFIDAGYDLLKDKGFDGHFITHYLPNPLEENPRMYAVKKIQDKMRSILEQKRLLHSSIFLAQEYIFNFVQKFHVQMGLSRKNSYSVSEIEEGFFSYMPRWLVFTSELMWETDRNNFRDRQQWRQSKYDLDFLMEILEDERKKIDRKVRKSIEKKEEVSGIALSLRNYSIREFINSLNHLRQLGSEITGVYKDMDEQLIRAKRFIWNCYHQEDTEYNLRTFFELLPKTYDDVVALNFPNLKKEFSFFGKFNHLIIQWNIDENFIEAQRGPTYSLSFLYAPEKTDKTIEVLGQSTESPLDLKRLSKDKVLEYKGNRYTAYSGLHGILDFIYDDLPMLNYIYDNLAKKIEEYFKLLEKDLEE